MALVGPNVGVDEDVTLHVGQQGEFTTTDATLVLLHPLKNKITWKLWCEKDESFFWFALERPDRPLITNMPGSASGNAFTFIYEI